MFCIVERVENTKILEYKEWGDKRKKGKAIGRREERMKTKYERGKMKEIKTGGAVTGTGGAVTGTGGAVTGTGGAVTGTGGAVTGTGGAEPALVAQCVKGLPPR